MTYTPTTDSRIDHYRKEAMEHLEKGEIYYARGALNKGIEIYERALNEENADVFKADTRYEVGGITLVHTSDNDFVIKHGSDAILISIDEARTIAAIIDEA